MLHAHWFHTLLRLSAFPLPVSRASAHAEKGQFRRYDAQRYLQFAHVQGEMPVYESCQCYKECSLFAFSQLGLLTHLTLPPSRYPSAKVARQAANRLIPGNVRSYAQSNAGASNQQGYPVQHRQMRWELDACARFAR